jgi:hypothetical protein
LTVDEQESIVPIVGLLEKHACRCDFLIPPELWDRGMTACGLAHWRN